MDAQKKQALIRKYENFQGPSQKKTLNVTGRANRQAAMTRKGKPKNTKQTILRLFQYLSKERKLLIVALICSIFFAITSLAGSYMLRPIINEYIFYDGKDASIRIQGLFMALGILAMVYGSTVLLQWLQARLMLQVSQKSLHRMRKDLYERLQELPISYFDGHISGDIMSRFTNDVDTIGEMLNTTLSQMVSGMITIAGTIILMIYTNWILASITIVMTPLLTYVSKWIIQMGKDAFTIQQNALGTLNGFAQESINGTKVVKIFNHEKVASEEFEFLNDRLCQAQIHAQFRAGIMGPVTHQLCNMCYALTACVGAILVVVQGFDIGGLTVSVNYTRQFNRPINEISMQMNTVFAALAGAERVFEVLDEQVEDVVSGVKPEIRGGVELKNVNFSYRKGHEILHSISLQAYSGQKIALVGSTGAGKTTITNLLTRFYDIDSGQILIDGLSIQEINRPYLREHVAMVLQDTHLFTGTVMENIRYGRMDATDMEVIEAAKIACAHSFISHLENGYNTYLEHDGSNLSQGQRQLLNIARAALSKAPILVLDEATSSVDTRTERQIEKGLDNLMKNRTTFVIAHRLSTVRKSDCIMVLEHGRIIEKGNHENLLALHGRYYDLYNQVIELD